MRPWLDKVLGLAIARDRPAMKLMGQLMNWGGSGGGRCSAEDRTINIIDQVTDHALTVALTYTLNTMLHSQKGQLGV